jgi:hypothetical protein
MIAPASAPLALDHLVIGATQLDTVSARLAALGFAVTPEGGHPSLGTRNRTVLFAGHYLEWLALAGPAPADPADYRAILRRSEGVCGFAFKSDDIARSCVWLAAHGASGRTGRSFTRPVETDAGPAEARFEVVFFPSSTSDSTFAFFCRHFTPELVWRTDALSHRNGVVAVTAVQGWFAAAVETERVYRERFGIPADAPQVDLGGPRLVFGEAGVPSADQENWIHLTFATRDLAAARRCCTEAGALVQPTASGGLLALTRAELGVDLAFEPIAA